MFDLIIYIAVLTLVIIPGACMIWMMTS